MKKLSSISLLLTLTLIMSLLTSCGSSEPNAQSNADKAISSSVTMTKNTDKESEIAGSITDAENAKSTWLTNSPITLSLWKVWPPFLSNMNPSEAYHFRYLEELLNVKMDVHTIGTDAAAETFNLMVASGDMTDLIESAAGKYSGGGTKAIDDGILYDLADYLPEYAPEYYDILMNDPIAPKALIDSDGKISQFMGFYDAPMMLTRGLWIRQDWLDELELEQPETLTELETVMDAFLTKYQPKDTYAMREDCEAMITNAFGAHFDWYVKNGAVVYGKEEKVYQEYLGTLHKWYEKGYFSSDFVTANDSTAPLSAMVLANETGIVAADKTLISDIFAGAPTGTVNMQPLAPITKNADDKISNAYISTKLLTSSSVSISTCCETPEIAVAYINAGFWESNKMALNYGEEGVTFIYDIDGTPKYTELITANPDIPGAFATLAYIAPGIPSIRDLELYNSTYTYEAQIIADDIFTSKDNGDESTIFPKDYLTYSVEEAEIIAKYETELDTYLDEAIAKFITGALSVEDDFDDFVMQLHNVYGLDELQAAKQSAFKRFNQSR